MNSQTTQSLNHKEWVPSKKWSELNSDEKIERMRDIIKNLQNQLATAEIHIHNLRLKLRNHTHHDGKVYEMKEVNDYDDDGAVISGVETGLIDRDYF